MRVQLEKIASETMLGQPLDRTHSLTFNEIVPAAGNTVPAGSMASMIVGTGVTQIITDAQTAATFEIGALYDVSLAPVA